MIRTYTPSDAAACADLYNEVRQGVPTFVPVDAESLHRAVTGPESYHDEVADGTALLAADAVGPRGWVALCRRRPGPDARWAAVIRALCAPPDALAVIGDLVAAAREWAGAAPVLIGGSGGLRFGNGGDCALPESTGLGPLLLRCGMRLTHRELILQGPVADAASPAGTARVEAADDHGSCRALVGGTVVGECWVDRAARYSSHPEAASHAFVQWIGTEAEWRGRGVGRRMWAFMSARLHRVGVRRISLSTPCDNFAAHAFYLRAGLRVVDQGLGLRTGESA